MESEAQLADLLASEADRRDELSAEVARAGTAAARWERKYVALKEGVGTLVSSVRDERARVHAARAAMEPSLASISTMADTVTPERDSVARELEELQSRNEVAFGADYYEVHFGHISQVMPAKPAHKKKNLGDLRDFCENTVF